jgi:outer membrane biosynthesis protein TonB
MSETVKKTKPSPKPRKSAATKEAAPKPAPKKAAAPKKAPAPKKAAPKRPRAVVESIEKNTFAPTYEQIAELARRYWAERGYTDGQHENDWFRAEQELRSKAS